MTKSQSFALHTSSESNEWYTPPEYIELARNTLGTIDLDPASCDFAQEWIQANTYYTKETNGLLHNWSGKVFVNPPYGEIPRKDGGGNPIPLPDWYVDTCQSLGLPLNTKNQELWSRFLEREYYRESVDEAILLVRAAFGYNWVNYLLRSYPCVTTWDRIRFINQKGRKAKAKVSTNFFYFGPDVETFLYNFEQVGFYSNAFVWDHTKKETYYSFEDWL